MKGPDTGGRILDAYKDQFLAGIFFHKSRVDSDSAFFINKGIGYTLLQSQAQFRNIFPAGSADAQIKSIRQSTPKLQNPIQPSLTRISTFRESSPGA